VPAPRRDAAPDADARVLAVDPGLRVGLAWVDGAGGLLRAEVTDLEGLARLEVPAGVVVVVGDGTGMRAARAALTRPGRDVVVVDEHATSEEGRRLYWRDHPPRGWRRWLPAGLRVAPRPVDDYAAYAIALRWLGQLARRDPVAPGAEPARERGR
jgi:hypothetical protein